jgi:hypothetical protein
MRCKFSPLLYICARSAVNFIHLESVAESGHENEKRLGNPESASRRDSDILLVRQGKEKLRLVSSASSRRLHARTYETLYRSAGFLDLFSYCIKMF